MNRGTSARRSVAQRAPIVWRPVRAIGAAPARHPVLVVDDDSALLTVVSSILEDEGYEVLSAIDGMTALEAVERWNTRLILLDVRMPGLSGAQVATELRRRGHDVRIVVMTAEPDARRWLRELHAVDALPKPFDASTLLEVVSRHMGNDGG